MAGYSGTPLAKKLGIKPGHRVALLAAPRDFEAALQLSAGENVVVTNLRGKAPCDVIVLFAGKMVDLADRFPKAAAKLASAGGLWAAWPKKASGVMTDVSEPHVREYGLAQGLVDNKICAIDDVWSGLRFVIRLKDRPRERR